MFCLNILSVYIDAKKVEEKLLAQNINIIYMNISLQMFGTDLPFPAESPDHLWFYYINNNRTFMLDGQGVTAEVVEPDIGNFFLKKKLKTKYDELIRSNHESKNPVFSPIFVMIFLTAQN